MTKYIDVFCLIQFNVLLKYKFKLRFVRTLRKMFLDSLSCRETCQYISAGDSTKCGADLCSHSHFLLTVPSTVVQFIRLYTKLFRFIMFSVSVVLFSRWHFEAKQYTFICSFIFFYDTLLKMLRL